MQVYTPYVVHGDGKPLLACNLSGRKCCSSDNYRPFFLFACFCSVQVFLCPSYACAYIMHMMHIDYRQCSIVESTSFFALVLSQHISIINSLYKPQSKSAIGGAGLLFKKFLLPRTIPSFGRNHVFCYFDMTGTSGRCSVTPDGTVWLDINSHFFFCSCISGYHEPGSALVFFFFVTESIRRN